MPEFKDLQALIRIDFEAWSGGYAPSDCTGDEFTPVVYMETACEVCMTPPEMVQVRIWLDLCGRAGRWLE